MTIDSYGASLLWPAAWKTVMDRDAESSTTFQRYETFLSSDKIPYLGIPLRTSLETGEMSFFIDDRRDQTGDLMHNEKNLWDRTDVFLLCDATTVSSANWSLQEKLSTVLCFAAHTKSADWSLDAMSMIRTSRSQRRRDVKNCTARGKRFLFWNPTLKYETYLTVSVQGCRAMKSPQLCSVWMRICSATTNITYVKSIHQEALL